MHGGKTFGYVDARKAIYVPIYHDLVIATPVFKELKTMVEEGSNVLIVDLDGPPPAFCESDGTLEVTIDSLKKMINEPSALFGHGYIVAAALKSISIQQFCC